MSSQQICVITNVDSQVGFALAYRLLEERRSNNRGGNDNQGTIRLLCRNKEGLDPLTQLGGEVYQVDYNAEDQVREALKSIHAVILVPEHDYQRVKYGETIIRVAKEEDVNHLCMISIVGVGKIDQSGGQEYKHLKQYNQLEQIVKETMGSKEKHSIVRLTLPTQFFYFLAPTLEERNVLRLPVKKDRKWSTVDLYDSVDAIVKLSNETRQGSPQGLTSALGNLFVGGHLNKQVYQFTPRKWITVKELTEEIGEGLQRDSIKYEEVDTQEFKKILQELRDDHRFKERPNKNMPNDPTPPAGGNRQDRPFTFPLGRYLNDPYIETLIEVMDLVNQGQHEHATDDLKQILGREPQDIKSFFKNNRRQFQDLR
ncbi:hypothetical protein [Absidia glauca]|uniref:NAD(P)-binding domain-containing protein n=1 Tax=Absidia glauca TaxID=4829 RepID=A0A168SW23_ABSGL|nr:hypothetical protein [Absidia glauca]